MAQSAAGRRAGPLVFQTGGRATALSFARLAAAALASSAALAGAAGCGGSHPRPAALRLERRDLVLLAHTLQRLQAPARDEVGAARTVWPALAGGLPRSFSPAMQLSVAAAERSAGLLALPAFVTTEGSLTGPAAKLAGMLKAYTILTQRGWPYIAATITAESRARARSGGASGARATRSSGASEAVSASTTSVVGVTPPAAQFLRANAGLYIYCIYDGHYDLSLIGKALRGAYRTLGGAPAFGTALPQSQVEALARSYSIPSSRLAPHPPSDLSV